ncbi:hypothetical protein [Nitrosomonas sp. Is37]|nr:hypothetical protein [Nitrosomonas sp. Is37]MDV6345872.1 hypothetical protein [Nitrosomonas sp. Is37]
MQTWKPLGSRLVSLALQLEDVATWHSVLKRQHRFVDTDDG